MKTSSSSLRSAKRLRTFFAGTALVLKPFGPVADLIKTENPWHGFKDEGPVLTMVRAQKIKVGAAGQASCKDWVEALSSDSIGHTLGAASSEEYAVANPKWAPWSKEELEGIADCDSKPCAVKLDEAESAQMKTTEKSARKTKWFELILARVHGYQKTQTRKAYEFDGDPVDPWKYFETLGLKSPLSIPTQQHLDLRRVEFFPGRVKTMHQILDTRIAGSSDRQEATLWRRDVYTDHYFDSWGEWMDVSCEGGEATLVQAVMLELDLMKKTDILSKMMRSKMRGAAEDNGAIYLDKWYERLRQHAAAAVGEKAGAGVSKP